MLEATLASTTATDDIRATVRRIVDLAVRGLPPMFDHRRQLFCYKLKKIDGGMVQEGISQRYTMMTLLGLHRFEQAGGVSPIAAAPVLDSLLSDFTWVDNVGNLGVLLWMCAMTCPDRLPALAPKLQVGDALSRYAGARQGITMELAWFLTGLCYWGMAQPEKLHSLEPIAFETYRKLKLNQGERGFFGHLARSGSLNGVLRGRIGSFADQVYPIYAFAQFSKAYQNDEAAQLSLKCALRICEAQGSMGQWWWHYDSIGGQVADGYPVFSVHQHAMAPMTLFGLGEIIHHDFDEWIYKGLRWINSNNELRYEMEDGSSGVIWRCIFRSQRSLVRYLKAGLGRYSETVQHDRPEELKVLFECRPYELGWLLYAFANRTGVRSPASSKVQMPTYPSRQSRPGAN